MQRLLPPMLVFLLLAAMTGLHFLFPGPVIVPHPYNWLGLILAGAGLCVTLAAAGLFRRRNTNIKTFNDPTELVTDGCFRWSRNPMYLGFAMLLFGAGIAFGSLLPALIPILFVIACQFWYIPFEEQAMTRQFGDAYRAYAEEVRRWI